MSLEQLDNLWRYESLLLSFLMDQPLRTCKARPTHLPNVFPSMEPEEFRLLKRKIRMMWVQHPTSGSARNWRARAWAYSSQRRMIGTLNKRKFHLLKFFLYDFYSISLLNPGSSCPQASLCHQTHCVGVNCQSTNYRPVPHCPPLSTVSSRRWLLPWWTN